MSNFKAGLRIRKPWSTMTDNNHLGAAFMAKPQHLGMIVDELFVNKTYGDYPLYSQLSSGNKTIKIDSWPNYTYDVGTAMKRPVTIIEDVMPTGTRHGSGNLEFRILVDEPYLLPGDEISPGNVDYQVRIQTAPQRVGNGWLHNVQAKLKGINQSIPSRYFVSGTPWGKLWASAEEGNQEKGSTMFYTPGMTLSMPGGKINKMYKMTDYAAMNRLGSVCQIGVMMGGKKFESWVTLGEYQATKEWMMEINRYLWFDTITGPSNRIYGSTRYQVDHAPGLIEQIKANGHVLPYQTLTAKSIKEFINRIVYGRVKPSQRGVLYVYTGEIGAQNFSEIMMQELVSQNVQLLADHMISKHSSEFHSNAYTLGMQVTGWRLPNGIEIRLVHEPAFDDINIHFEMDPLTGYPKMSQTYVFMEIGADSMNSNVVLIEPKSQNGHKVSYRMGNVDITGYANGDFVATTEDSFSVTYTKYLSALIKDPTRTGIMYLNR